MKNTHIRNMVFAAIFAALIFAATAVFPFPLPGGGYANLGDAFIIAAAFFTGPVWGFFAGAIGSSLSDLFLGYAVYAPATFVIKGLMATVFALVCSRHIQRKIIHRVPLVIAASVISESVMVAGYFLFECIIYSPVTATVDIAGNLVQAAVGIAASTVLVCILSANKSVMKISFGGKSACNRKRNP